MTQQNNDNKNLTGFAMLLAAVFGSIWGANKIANKLSSNPELERLRTAIDDFFIKGDTEAEIVSIVMADASDKLGELNEETKNNIKRWVSEEKAKLESQGRI